jgi:hypothetical protein
MIAEIPDPECPRAKNSRFLARIKKAKAEFLKYEHTYNHHLFRITGVLFIDKKHPKPPTGNNANNVELHPVIRLKEIMEF